jgi:hypothetical protein
MYFHTKNPNLGKLEDSGMENVGKFCGRFEYCAAIWCIYSWSWYSVPGKIWHPCVLILPIVALPQGLCNSQMVQLFKSWCLHFLVHFHNIDPARKKYLRLPAVL